MFDASTYDKLIANELRPRFGDDASHAHNNTKGLINLISTLPHLGLVVEVGSYFGTSSEAFGLLADRVICVDHFSGQEEHALPVFFEVMKRQRNISLLRMMSHEAAWLFSPFSVDLVYIDAAHDYDNVKADIIAWRCKAKRVAGHDYHANEGGVIQAVNEEFGKVQVFSDSSWLATEAR